MPTARSSARALGLNRDHRLVDSSEAHLAGLIGAHLTGLGRAASLQHFTFRLPGGSEKYLHTEVPWRLTDNSGILAGRADYWRAATAETVEEDLDAGELGATLRDVRNETLREHVVADNPVVTGAAVDRFGGLTLEFSNGWRLEVFPDASRAAHDQWEYWRLFQRRPPHYVVTSDGAASHG